MDVAGRALRRAARGAEGARTAPTPDTDLDGRRPARASSTSSRRSSRRDTGRDFPTDPLRAARPRDQGRLRVAGSASARSDYRKQPEDRRTTSGTAVNVVTMVFGNMGDDSGHRRRLHPRPEHRREGALRRVPDQRPGRGRGRRHPDAAEDRPDARRHARRSTPSSSAIGQQLEQHYRDVQDLEFTIERGRLYMLQTRSAKRTAAAAVKIAVDMVDEGVDHARTRRSAAIEPAQVDQLLRDQFDPKAAPRARSAIAKGLNASPGAAVGRAVFDADAAVEWVGRGEKVVLVRDRDLAGRLPRHGRRRGHPHRARRRDRRTRRSSRARSASRASPAAPSSSSTTRRRRRACTSTGRRRSTRATGSASTARPARSSSARCRPSRPASRTSPSSSTILGWADEIRRHGGLDQRRQARGGRPGPRATAPRASACAAPSTCSARASGSRSCAARSSSPNVATRAKAKAAAGERARRRRAPRRSPRFDAAMAKLEVLQQGDFEGIFEAMDGLPVVDPPDRPAAPRVPARTSRSSSSRSPRAEAHGGASEEDKELLATIKSMHEQNPMLGLRGCRLGLMIPDFVKIQTRAILNAADRGQAARAATRSPRS